MLTLLFAITDGISWEQALNPLREVSLLAVAVLIFYIIISFFTILNVVTGVFVNTAIERANYDRDIASLKALQRRTEQMKELQEAFEDIDEGQTNEAQFVALFQQHQAHQRNMEQLTRGHARDVKTLFTLIDTDNSGSCEQVSWEVAEEIWGSFQIYWAQKPKGPLLLKPILGPKEAIQHINYQVLEVAREEMTSLRSLFDSWYEHRQFNDVLSPAPPGILSIRSVAVELRHAIDRMQRRNSWPRFLLESKDKGPARQLSSEEVSWISVF
ncbi:hypothetical protein AK812_SmicGene36531 [Symbiodinium microadriaticum]|uniref:Ion transport domain-containing protein n=1 Tax=Symbiodinium microadriaticum TaxID=2951 RepID=A0A1Q9CIN1_SYMMI|nr:hypothetical protein AK812_SmicGene36531 [Symbiodinium microadriaticum]